LPAWGVTSNIEDKVTAIGEGLDREVPWLYPSLFLNNIYINMNK
jgi:hypothetical protein